MRRLGCVLLVVVGLAGGLLSPVAAEGAYAPPVAGPVIDHFRPPASPYGPGNRGIDFATTQGDVVRAAADGEVVFAGRVGLSQHVVVLHPDGLRTSYSFLAEVDVRRGDRVRRGDPVGRAGPELHFGVRADDDRYLDPEPLLDGASPQVHLIPARELRARSIATEGRALLRSLAGLAGAGAGVTASGVRWARDQVVDQLAATADVLRAQLDAVVTAIELTSYYANISDRMLELVSRASLFTASQAGCTPAMVAPRRRPGRRIAVLVGGLGSASGDAAVLDVDTRALGYADGDVTQFSYAGGQSPGRRHLLGVPTSAYRPTDANSDLVRAATRFRQLLVAIRIAHPGTPVDVIAHSQGGLVARAALGADGDRFDPGLPLVEHVITLGSPHHGADLATADAALGTSTLGQVAQVGLRLASRGRLDATSAAAAQLAETSSFIRALQRRPLPGGARVTSIAARGDLVVPVPEAALAGATDVVVPVGGPRAHDALPGAPATARELALALADQGPTCRSLGRDLVAGSLVSVMEDGLGGALLAGGRSLRWLGRPAGG